MHRRRFFSYDTFFSFAGSCSHIRLCRKSPPPARERAIFSPGKDGEAGDIGFIVDGAGCSQAGKGSLEARATSPTEPSAENTGMNISIGIRMRYGKCPDLGAEIGETNQGRFVSEAGNFLKSRRALPIFLLGQGLGNASARASP